LATDRKPTSANDLPEQEQNDTPSQQPLSPRVSRRFFLSSLGPAGLAATTSPVLAATATLEPAVMEQESEAAEPAGAIPVTL
jgi:hypothetical protein